MNLLRLERWLLQSPGLRTATIVATDPSVRGAPVRILVRLSEDDHVGATDISVLAETALGRALDLVETSK